MKVRDLIKCAGYKPTPTPIAMDFDDGSDSPIPRQSTEKPTMGETTLLELEETNLDDDEITEVLSYLLKLQDEYFGQSLPLANELCQKFVWNMPREVYKSFKDSLDYDIPDALNILTLFYAFCMQDVSRTGMFKFIDRLHSMIHEVDTQETLDVIYYNDYADEPYDDEPPVDNSSNLTDDDCLITTT